MQIDPIRFWINVTITDDHWLWNAGKSQTGYGYFWVNGRTVSAHRVAWELQRGEISDGLHLHHMCETPLCVNPDHLEMVTPREHQHIHLLKSSNTHCRHGHAYTDRNTYFTPSGKRQCRACNAASKRRAYHSHVVSVPQ